MKILITGGSSGIGEAIIDRYMHEDLNHEIYCISRTEPNKYFRNITWLEFDLSKPHGLKKLLESIPVPDRLINNAGQMVLDDFDITWSSMVEQFQVNLFSAFELSRILIPKMMIQEKLKAHYSVLNVSSTAGIGESDFAMVYGMTKAAMLSMTRSFAHKFAPLVRVNAICPGFTKSNLVDGETPPELIEELVPLKFEADASDIANMAFSILENRFMTGSTVVIDGGELNG